MVSHPMIRAANSWSERVAKADKKSTGVQTHRTGRMCTHQKLRTIRFGIRVTPLSPQNQLHRTAAQPAPRLVATTMSKTSGSSSSTPTLYEKKSSIERKSCHQSARTRSKCSSVIETKSAHHM